MLKTRIAVVSTLIAAATILASCSGATPAAAVPTQAVQNTASPATAAPTAPATEIPAIAKAGHLVVGDPTEPDTLDPACTFSTFGDNQYKALFDSLIFWGADKNYYPNLAETWDASTDGKTYTFHLRAGVKFHDGTPFNAQAVKVNLDRIGKVKCSVGKEAVSLLGDSYDSAEVVDDATVKIHFSKPFAKFLDSAAFLYFSSPAALDKDGENYGRHPVGTGPFVFKEWIDKDHLTVTRNPDYNWAPGNAQHTGPAYLDDITWRFIPESSTLVSSLEGKETQLIRGFEVTSVDEIRADQALVVMEDAPPGAPTGWNLNVQLAPLDDIRVRQAVGDALDRATMVKTLFGENLNPAYGALTRSTWSYWPGSEDYFKFDPAKAKSLLDDAGWKDSDGDGIRDKGGEKLTLNLLDITDPQRIPAWEFLQAELKDVGIDLHVEFAESGSVFDRCVAGTPHICPVHWGMRDPAELSSLWATENIGTGFNWARLSDSKIDSLLAAGSAEMDRTKREQIYQDLQKEIMDQAAWIPIFEDPGFWAATKSLKGAVVLPSVRHIWLYDAYIEP